MAEEKQQPLTEEIAQALESVVNEGAKPEEKITVGVTEEKTPSGKRKKRIRVSGSKRALARARIKLSDLTTLAKIKTRLGYALNKHEYNRLQSIEKMVESRSKTTGKTYKVGLKPNIKSEYAGHTIAGYHYQGKRLRHNNQLSKSAHDKYSNVMSEVWRQVNAAIDKHYDKPDFKSLFRSNYKG